MEQDSSNEEATEEATEEAAEEAAEEPPEEAAEEAVEEAAEEALSDTSAPGLFLEQAEGEETLIAQLIASQDANEELCAELKNARDDYDLATGTMGEGIPRTDY